MKTFRLVKMSSKPVYCLCRQPYDGKRFMIECDLCQDWFHGGCVGIEEKIADDIDIYHCPNCEVLHGPSIMKKQHGSCQELTFLKREPLSNVSLLFIHQLQSKPFESSEEVLLKPTGSQLTVEFLEEHSFSRPILILKKDGLGMKLPPTTFTVRDVEKWVGSDKVIDAIDVASQASFKMRLGDFVKYYYSEKRENAFNIISLEFSNTLLSNIVEMPKIVRKLSWVENLWPEECGFERPNVQKYCFMSVKGSYTDFHIAFGAPSIWYHVLKGEKIFYLIHPTNDNLTLFECWNKSYKHKEVFFGDQVDKCYKCSVKQGQTLFIPAGWIHAVLTPVDCLAFGGKFIHSLNIEMQLKAYEIQKKLSIADVFILPRFETICWHVGKEILDILGGLREQGRCPASYLVRGCKALAKAFQTWTRKEVLPDHEDEIPKTVQTTQLIEDLAREISLVEDTFQHKIHKMNSNFQVQQPFLANSTSLTSPNNSTSVSKLTLSLPFKSGPKEKFPKHKDIFTKAGQLAKENPVLESNGQHNYNAMDLNHQVLRAGSSLKVDFNITSTCWNNSDVCSISHKFFDGNESLLMAEGSAKKGKSLPQSQRAKSIKKRDNSRLVGEQVKGDNFDVSSKDELQFQETLCKEKEGLILRPKIQTNMLYVKFCIEQNQIHERWETVTTSENFKTEQELVQWGEDKLRGANGSDRILDPLKARKQVEKPDCVVLSEDPGSSSIKETMKDNVFVADSQSSSPKPAPSSVQAMQMRRMDKSNERLSSGLDTVSNSSVPKRTPWKWPIKRLVYTRIQGNLGTSSKDAEDSYLLLESDHGDDDDDDSEDDRAFRTLPKKRKF